MEFESSVIHRMHFESSLIELEISPIQLKSYLLIELESSPIELESSLIQLESSLIQLESSFIELESSSINKRAL